MTGDEAGDTDDSRPQGDETVVSDDAESESTNAQTVSTEAESQSTEATGTSWAEDDATDDGADPAALVAAVEDDDWTESVTVEDGTVTIRTTDAPDLRSVYDDIDETAGGDGAVAVVGEGQEWRVTYRDGTVADVERAGSAYTVRRMTLGQRFFSSVGYLGLYVAMAGVLTAVASLVLATPVSGLESLGLAVGGVVVFFVANFLNGIWEELTGGAQTEQPGEELAGFDALPGPVQAALVAFDDEKSTRNLGAVMNHYRLSPHLLGIGLVVYLMGLAYVNFGGVGVLAAGVLVTLKTAVGVVLSLFLGFGLDELSVARAKVALDEVHEEARGSTKPRLLVYGDSSNPVHENVPLALPELDVIVLPKADAQKFHPDELRSVIAHEYEHVQSHSPMLLTLVKVVLLVAPGILLVATGASPPVRVFAGGVFATLVVGFAALALVTRRWEGQADDTAATVGTPLGMAFALTRLTDRHVVDDEVSILTGATGQLYGSHPYPRRRVETLLTRADDE